jgi:hypothetical protein
MDEGLSLSHGVERMEKVTVFWVKESDYYDNPRHKTKKDWVVRIERELELRRRRSKWSR